MALITHPPLLESDDFPGDAKARARELLEGCRGGSVGAYSDSPGIEIIRSENYNRHFVILPVDRDKHLAYVCRKTLYFSGSLVVV